ncbi:MAG: HDOD domain-containing protein [Chitinivibrionales bacterium]|nr:HDOD domain-containing protein [Chitinivibrionales bacterium]
MNMEKQRSEIIARLSSIEGLPSLSSTMVKLKERVCNTDTSLAGFGEIAAIIEQDVGLAMKIMRMANSVHYTGKYGDISSIDQAISRLGIDMVCRLCLAAAAMELFPVSSNLISLSDFWRHSIGVALTVRQVGERRRLVDSDGYIAGLFHDIGILVLDRHFYEGYAEARNVAKKENIPVYEAERRSLGIDHGEIGGLLCRLWRLPEDVATAVSFHHFPEKAPEPFVDLTQVVHLSDFACSALGVFEPGDLQLQECSFSAWDNLGIGMEEMRKIIEYTESRIAETDTFVALSQKLGSSPRR